MIVAIALLVALLAGCATYLLMQRRLLQVVLGVTLLSHAAVLIVFASGGLVVGRPAFVDGPGIEPGAAADPLPQALILTAIVISFGTGAFLLALTWRIWNDQGDDDVAAWRSTEPPADPGPPAEPTP